MRDSGVDAIMLGRATLGNPWLISQIRDLMEGREARPSPSANRIGCAFACALPHDGRRTGEARAVPQMRKHVALYLKGIPGAATCANASCMLDRAVDAIAVIEETIARLEAPVAA